MEVPAGDGTTHSLYWIRLPAKTRPAKGTLFYLAGGPSSHLEYTQMAAAFQKLAYPQLDVVLYDYFGYNCSSALQRVALLDSRAHGLTVPAMAADFIELKRHVIGSAKAYLMGGSHGAMLGAQIVADHPGDVEKAILFSGDLESGWLAEGWFRFDAILTQLAANDPDLATNLDRLFERARRGQLVVDIDGKQHVVDGPSLEVGLWLAGGLSSTVQAALPIVVKLTLDGDLEALAAIYGGELQLLAPIQAAPPPTEISVVTNFHRCNVWFPRSGRASPALAARRTKYLAYASFERFWSQLCKDYDHLGEFPFHAVPAQPTTVPILAWVGDHDSFDPAATRARFERLSTHVDFHVMAGWSHDFGLDEVEGFGALAKQIAAFLE